MKLGICSYSFHRTCAAGKMDIFSFIAISKELGCSQLDPWNAHLSLAASGKEALQAGQKPSQSRLEPPADFTFLDRVKQAAAQAGLPFGCIAVDGAHIYEVEEAKRKINRTRAYRWIDIAGQLGAAQVRIDAGGPADLPDDVFQTIVDGYRDVIAYAQPKGVEVLVENHWGPTTNPDNVLKLLDAVKGLGLLFDSNNWIKERREEAWKKCAARSRALHIKTFAFDEQGFERTMNLKPAFDLLNAAGYRGAWGVESVPVDGDELSAVKQTIALIRKFSHN
jgi:sugar phosphate isomerase/epimerase